MFSGNGEVISLNFKDGIAGTIAAMEKGAGVIYQAPLSAGGFRGVADFLVKLPDGGYEVWDAKLAKHPKPTHGVQLCCYSEMLSAIQGGETPSRGCLVLDGASTITPIHLSSYDAYYRSLKNRFLEFQNCFDPALPPAIPHLGSPVGRWSGLLKGLLSHRDDVSLVAGVGRREAEKLKAVKLTASSLGALEHSQVSVTAK